MSHDWERHYAGEQHDHQQQLSSSTAELAGFLAGAADRPTRALDLGCGTGADAVFLAENGVEVTGIDLSATALEHAKQRADRHEVRVDWLLGDVLQVPLDDGSMDLVLDRGCLHHVAAEDHGQYAAEVARVLRPGGTLLIREMNEAGHHAHAVSEASLQAMVESAPLRMRSVVTYPIVRGDRSGRAMLAVIDRL